MTPLHSPPPQVIITAHVGSCLGLVSKYAGLWSVSFARGASRQAASAHRSAEQHTIAGAHRLAELPRAGCVSGNSRRNGYLRLWDRSESEGGVAKLAPLTERLAGQVRRMTAPVKANLVLGWLGFALDSGTDLETLDAQNL